MWLLILIGLLIGLIEALGLWLFYEPKGFFKTKKENEK